MELHKPYIAVRNGDGIVYNFTVTKINKKTAKGYLVFMSENKNTKEVFAHNSDEVTVNLSNLTIKGCNDYHSLKVYEKYSNEAVKLIKKYNDRMYAIQVRNYIQNIVTDAKIGELLEVGKALKLEPIKVFS